jgi:RNA polymerase sigma-70 factor (ECF subfamily)
MKNSEWSLGDLAGNQGKLAEAQYGSLVESLYVKYANNLRAFLRRYLKREDEVDESVQEAFLHVWRQEQRGALRENARAYLFATALNVIRDKWRRDRARHRDQHVELSEDIGAARNTEEDQNLLWKEGIRMLERELAKLKPSTRAVFLMHHVEHLSFQDIAAKLNVSTRTVEREMAKALDHCRGALTPFFSDTGEG